MFDLCKMIGYWRRQGDGFSYFMRGEEGRRGGGGGGGGVQFQCLGGGICSRLRIRASRNLC